jgi:hypothetical protein
LKCVSDETPVGESVWIIVNKDLHELKKLEMLIRAKFPSIKIISVHQDFASWIKSGCIHLKAQGVIT